MVAVTKPSDESMPPSAAGPTPTDPNASAERSDDAPLPPWLHDVARQRRGGKGTVTYNGVAGAPALPFTGAKPPEAAREPAAATNAVQLVWAEEPAAAPPDALWRGESQGARLREVYAASVDGHGQFTPSSVLLVGELSFAFDEVAQLRATLCVAQAFGAGSDALRSAVLAAAHFLAAPNLLTGPTAAEGLQARIAAAFADARWVDSGYLAQETERALLNGRHYQRRRIYGGVHVRGALSLDGPALSAAFPVYIPDAATDALPLHTRFRARLMAEVRAREDQYESHPVALRVRALGRLVPCAPW